MPSSNLTTNRRVTTRTTQKTTLEKICHQRIANRLGHRVRNLVVAVDQGVIHLAGQCSTYYSKQLAQHAVLGVVEDETINNAIEVALPKPTS